MTLRVVLEVFHKPHLVTIGQLIPTANNRVNRFMVETSQYDPERLRLAGNGRHEPGKRFKRIEFVVSVSYDQQQTTRVDLAGTMPEQIKTRLVSPVKIFQHQQQRSRCSYIGEEFQCSLKQRVLIVERLKRLPITKEGRLWWQIIVRRIPTSYFDPRPIRWGRGQIVAASAQHQAVSVFCFNCQPLDQCRLADACFAADHCHRPISCKHVVERLPQRSLLALTANERRQ